MVFFARTHIRSLVYTHTLASKRVHFTMCVHVCVCVCGMVYTEPVSLSLLLQHSLHLYRSLSRTWKTAFAFCCVYTYTLYTYRVNPHVYAHLSVLLGFVKSSFSSFHPLGSVVLLSLRVTDLIARVHSQQTSYDKCTIRWTYIPTESNKQIIYMFFWTEIYRLFSEFEKNLTNSFLILLTNLQQRIYFEFCRFIDHTAPLFHLTGTLIWFYHFRNEAI